MKRSWIVVLLIVPVIWALAFSCGQPVDNSALVANNLVPVPGGVLPPSYNIPPGGAGTIPVQFPIYPLPIILPGLPPASQLPIIRINDVSRAYNTGIVLDAGDKIQFQGYGRWGYYEFGILTSVECSAYLFTSSFKAKIGSDYFELGKGIQHTALQAGTLYVGFDADVNRVNNDGTRGICEFSGGHSAVYYIVRHP